LQEGQGLFEFYGLRRLVAARLVLDFAILEPALSNHYPVGNAN